VKHEGDYLRRLQSGSLSGEEIAELLSDRRARKFHVVRRALAAHPRTPRVEALTILGTLFWRDLAWISADAKAHPEIRRAAEREIFKRMPFLARAEKADLARCAGRGVLAALRREDDPDIVGSILRNRLTVEADIVQLAAGSRNAGNLVAILADPAWGVRSAVQTAVARNAATPLVTAVGLLSVIPLADVREIAGERWRPAELLQAARAEVLCRLEGGARVV